MYQSFKQNEHFPFHNRIMDLKNCIERKQFWEEAYILFCIF